MSDEDLFVAKLSTFWDDEAVVALSPVATLWGKIRLQDQLDQLLHDGMLPHERRVTHLLEQHLGEPLPALVAHETLNVYRALSQWEQFDVLHGFHEKLRIVPAETRSKKFIEAHERWTERCLDQATAAWAALVHEMKGFSPADLRLAERHYLVHKLPPLPNKPYVQTRAARIVIAMVACSSVQGTRRNLHLNNELAGKVAARLDRHLRPKLVKKQTK
ncbi:hypothetical protein [Aliihoeflea sp. 2WW]|uniref:hypothetical protein n=1 Tax=Aliihoeflea sp. 2WW TaxID=1381123 RepID=UPI000463876B|nr:hypothetical protein [Aliihoeflea sp. 2WW]